ncbi:MAG: ribonuclease P protein subunit [Candidatus Micrarchaeia archaeon]
MKKKLQLIDFIGKKVEIVNSPCKDLIGLSGKIIDEYKEYFIVEIEKNEKKEKTKLVKIMKKYNVFKIENEIVNGSEIINNPEDR